MRLVAVKTFVSFDEKFQSIVSTEQIFPELAFQSSVVQNVFYILQFFLYSLQNILWIYVFLFLCFIFCFFVRLCFTNVSGHIHIHVFMSIKCFIAHPHFLDFVLN